MSNTRIDFNGASMRAVMEAVSALTFALARQLSPEQQDGLATDLSRLAKDAQNNGNEELVSLLQDMHQKARTGGGAIRPMSMGGGAVANATAVEITPSV